MKAMRVIQLIAVSITTALVVLTIGVLVMETTWATPTNKTGKDAFLYGTVGVELVPYSVFQVLPDLFPDHFQPAGKEKGDWIQQFGFIRGKPGVNDGLPVGFMLSNYRPENGAPSPVKFVALNCAACHSNLMRRSPTDEGYLQPGWGNTALDVHPWVDAVYSAILDEKRLSLDTVQQAYQAKFNQPLGAMDKLMTRFWLSGARKSLARETPKQDDPFGGVQLRNAEAHPNGPGRQQPFKLIIRKVMNRPGAGDFAYTKVATLYQQGLLEWAQWDGNLRNPLFRSVIAVMSAGTTLENSVVPEIYRNFHEVVNYVSTLQAPRYTEVLKDFGGTIDQEKANRGREVFAQHCSTCHGDPNPDGTWKKGSGYGEVIPVEQIGTDPGRVSFRHYEDYGDSIYNYFPEGHPFKPRKDEMRSTTYGYLAHPLVGAFARAPYLHNASVLTLAELINLKPRRDVFYRGENLYDPVDVGLLSPDQPDAKHYFTFDTRVKGNSNKGHDYPWAYQGPGWNKEILEDLLEYLKTL